MDTLLMAFIVTAAAAYVVWKFMPRGARAVLAARLARLAHENAGVPQHDAARLEQRLASTECGGCETCGGCDHRPRFTDKSNT